MPRPSRTTARAIQRQLQAPSFDERVEQAEINISSAELSVAEFVLEVLNLRRESQLSAGDQSVLRQKYTQQLWVYYNDTNHTILENDRYAGEGLPVIEVTIHNLDSGHCGYCSDQDESEQYTEEHDELFCVALPQYLTGVSDINTLLPSAFAPCETVECWCGGQTKVRRITNIRVL